MSFFIEYRTVQNINCAIPTPFHSMLFLYFIYTESDNWCVSACSQ